jgi:hypothetical protein
MTNGERLIWAAFEEQWLPVFLVLQESSSCKAKTLREDATDAHL